MNPRDGEHLLIHTGTAGVGLVKQGERDGRLWFDHRVLIDGIGRTAAVCIQDGPRHLCPGVLRDVGRSDTAITFRRYDAFETAVVLWDHEGPTGAWRAEGANGFGGPYQRISSETFARILNQAGALEDPIAEARSFARLASTKFRAEWSERVREAYAKDEHPDLDWELKALAAREVRITTEGHSADDARRRSYELLGTTTFPDAAVVWPFRCAIEYDRQTQPTNSSKLKTTLMKTAAHVLSGSYDAAVHVFVFHEDCSWGPKDYFIDGETPDLEHGNSRRLLMELEERGVFLAACFPRHP